MNVGVKKLVKDTKIASHTMVDFEYQCQNATLVTQGFLHQGISIIRSINACTFIVGAMD